MLIRHARPEDCATIAEIFNHAVLHTAAIWSDYTVDSENRTQWFYQRTGQGYPVLVAELEQQVVGYASFGDFRAFDGFRYTVEHSVYVHHQHQGKGVGKALMQELIREARWREKHMMVAGIESENQASVALHQRLGFTITGQMPQVGAKFGRWLDLTFMQLRLDDRSEPERLP